MNATAITTNRNATKPESEATFAGPLGYAPAPQCDVHDNTGRHCPEPPVYEVEHQGKRVRLCDGCHSMWLAGAYGRPAHNDGAQRPPT